MKNNNNSILALQHSAGGSCNFLFKKEARLKSLWIEIPDYCHLHCDYCYASTDEYPKDKKNYLQIEEYKKILKEFSNMGGQYVGIPGKGEPFHPKNWELTKEIITCCAENHLELAIFTTGDTIFFDPIDTITAEPKYDKIEVLKDKKVILLIKCNTLDCDKQNNLVHDRFGKYAQKREKAIEYLINEYKLNTKHRLGIVTSVLKDNENEISELYKWANDNNVIFDCDTILERGRGREYTSSGQVPSSIDLEKVFNKLKEVGAVNNCQGGTYVGCTCDRILHHLYISVTGDIFPCIGCLREDIISELNLGSTKDISLSKAWHSAMRSRLANHHKNVFYGVCKKCQNFIDEVCYSCLGRCTSFNGIKSESEGITIRTTGCIHHTPCTSVWLADIVDYIRRILSFEETHRILDEKGLEQLWRPNYNIVYYLLQIPFERRKHVIQDLLSQDLKNIDYSNIIQSDDIRNFSNKKYFTFDELSFPMNKVWDFIYFPDKLTRGVNLSEEDEKNILSLFSQNFLSNILLPSIKILLKKHSNSEVLIKYCNFMLYDNLHEKYFYRTIVKDIAEEKEKALIISRWYEDIANNKKCKRNIWKDYCYDLSDAFSDEIYSDYELRLENTKLNHKVSSKYRTIDISEILAIKEIQNRADIFSSYISVDNPEFISLYKKTITNEKVSVEDIMNNLIFEEIESDDIKNALVDFYVKLSNTVFFQKSNIDENLLKKVGNILNKNDSYKKLLKIYANIKGTENEIKFLNYFIYLGIMKKVLNINYYYIIYTTNFSSNLSSKDRESDLRSLIKPNGMLLCSAKPINTDFRAELKLFISSIFAPFDEYYFDKLIRKHESFEEHITAHQHTIFNISPHIKYSYKWAGIEIANINRIVERINSRLFQLDNSNDVIRELSDDIKSLKKNLKYSSDLMNEGQIVFDILDLIIRDSLQKIQESCLSGMKFTEIINFLCEYCRLLREDDYKQKILFDTTSSLENDFVPDKETAIDIFTVFYNLLTNANKASYYQKVMTVIINPRVEEDWNVIIENKGSVLLDNKNLDFINGKTNIPPRIGSGLSIVKKKIKKLGWKINVQPIEDECNPINYKGIKYPIGTNKFVVTIPNPNKK